MANTERFTTPSSFADEPGLTTWPEDLPRPDPDDPLYEGIMAAVYNYEFNGLYWRINDNGDPEPILPV